MNNQKISIVIPLYNKAAHILKTLESALAQSRPAFEIIVIDDGSTDGGPELVEELNAPQINLIRQKNGGVSNARNAGITASTGDWIAFLDADDLYHPNYLKTINNLIDKYPDVDMVATRYKSITADVALITTSWPIENIGQRVEVIHDLPRRWMASTCFFTSSVAVRTSRLQTMQPCFPSGESSGEDLDLWFRLGEKTDIAMENAPMVARVWVEEGLSVVNISRTEPPFLLRMAERAREANMNSNLRKSTQAFVDHNRLTLARTAIIAGDRLLARQLIGRAIKACANTRWWTTALMATIIPGPLVYHWQQWRKRRKMVLK